MFRQKALNQGFGEILLIALFLITIAVAPFIVVTQANAADSLSLDVIIRDFKGDGILFESGGGAMDKGLAEERLGADRKPVFISQKWFSTWPGSTQAMLNGLFNDAVGFNMKTSKTLVLTKNADGFYVSPPEHAGSFFPIDKELFGNEGRDHNYHFSTEFHGSFRYQGFGEIEFTSDDDFWLFVDNKLVINNGGLHSAHTEGVSLPKLVTDGILEIKSGDIVNIDFFFMERQSTGSSLYIKTNISNIVSSLTSFTNADFDPYFLTVLKTNYPSLFDGSGNIIPSAVTSFGSDGTPLTVAGKGLTSMRGIKCFASLQALDCSYNDMTELDLSSLSNLQFLDCNVNRLTNLDLTKLSNLIDVTCNRNPLSAIKVNGLSNLEVLGCGSNQLSTLDLTGLSSLKSLYCDNNQLTKLDVTHLSTLELLWCYSNQLTELKVSGLNDLVVIQCWDNKLTGLDVSQNAKLELLYCAENYMTSSDDVKGWRELKLIINSPTEQNSGNFRYYMQTTPALGKPAITTTSLPSGTVDTAYNSTLAATGNATITWGLDGGTLPNGLTLTQNGTISGTPTVAGTFSFTVKATNSAGNDIKMLSITINEDRFGCNAGVGIFGLILLGLVFGRRK
jgi:fibro-slime domain-containing protein